MIYQTLGMLALLAFVHPRGKASIGLAASMA